MESLYVQYMWATISTMIIDSPDTMHSEILLTNVEVTKLPALHSTTLPLILAIAVATAVELNLESDVTFDTLENVNITVLHVRLSRTGFPWVITAEQFSKVLMIHLVLVDTVSLCSQVKEIWSPLQAVNVPLTDEGLDVNELMTSPPRH